MNRILIIVVAVFLCIFSNAQSEYFQQNTNFEIHVKLNDSLHLLSGNLKLEYFNNSNVALDTIWFLLYPNAYKSEETALGKQQLASEAKLYFAKESQKGWIDSLNFQCNLNSLKWALDLKNPDLCYVLLKEPLPSGKSVLLETSFRVKIPDASISRFGHTDQRYAITQWFPKPAVFDKNSWHLYPYLNKGEFFYEYGKYDVYIDVPADYVVAASGQLVNDSEEENWLKNAKNYLSNQQNFNFRSADRKILHYQQDSIHDFAWFAAKEFQTKFKTFHLKNGKEIQLRMFFLPENTSYYSGIVATLESAVNFISEKVGNYPYSVISVVDGDLAAGGGMEYPTITIITKTTSVKELEEIVVHEIYHNWFYGILGFDERRFPFLDEGLTTFFTERFFNSYRINSENSFMGYDVPGLKLSQWDLYRYSYYFMQSRGLDIPVNSASDDFSEMSYAIMVYYKAAISFRYLNAYLGDNVFDAGMNLLFTNWHHKHPSPDDLKISMEKASGKNLDWFFKDLLATNKVVDYSICSLKKNKENTIQLGLKNKGEINSPVFLYAIEESGLMTDTIIIDGFSGKKIINLPTNPKVTKYVIDKYNFSTDVNFDNQEIKSKGLFKKLKKQRLNLLYALPNPEKRRMYFFPVYAYNSSNKSMLGLFLYNDLVFERTFEYRLMPLWSFQQNQLNGEMAFYLNFHKISHSIRKISFGVLSKKYTYNYTDYRPLNFLKIAPELTVYFKSPAQKSYIERNLKFIFHDVYNESVGRNGIKLSQYGILQAVLDVRNKAAVNPSSLKFDLQYNPEFLKLGLELKYKFNYVNKKTGLDIRFFAGKIFNAANSIIPYQLRMSNFGGSKDYLYSNVYLSRGYPDELFSAQMYETDGGFAINTPIGTTDKWLTAINIKSSLYKISFANLYFNAGTYSNAKNAFTGSQSLMYEGGIMLSGPEHFVEVYLPILYSSDIKQVLILNNQNTFAYKVRFIIKFDALNPVKYLREINL